MKCTKSSWILIHGPSKQRNFEKNKHALLHFKWSPPNPEGLGKPYTVFHRHLPLIQVVYSLASLGNSSANLPPKAAVDLRNWLFHSSVRPPFATQNESQSRLIALGRWDSSLVIHSLQHCIWLGKSSQSWKSRESVILRYFGASGAAAASEDGN